MKRTKKLGATSTKVAQEASKIMRKSKSKPARSVAGDALRNKLKSKRK